LLWDLETFEYEENVVDFIDPVQYCNEIQAIEVLSSNSFVMGTYFFLNRDMDDDDSVDEDFGGDSCCMSFWKIENENLKQVSVVREIGMSAIVRFVALPNKNLALVERGVKFYDYERGVFFLEYDKPVRSLKHLRDTFVIISHDDTALISTMRQMKH
jgi:hypothetical protein